MKIRSSLLTILSLTLATTVTAGSMFITLNAAAMQESAPEVVANLVQDAIERPDGDLAADAQVPAFPPVVQSLPPEEILHDRSHRVVLDTEGGFRGRLSVLVNSSVAPAAGYTVKVLQNGDAVGVTTSDEDGRFSFTGLVPGVGGLVAYSETGLMLYGLHLTLPEGETVTPAPEVELSIDSSVVAPADVRLAREMVLSAVTNEEIRFTGPVTEEDEKFFYGSGAASTSLISHQIQLRPDGTLHGEVNVLDERTGRNREVLDMEVHFLRDGKIVRSAEVDNNGSFMVSELNPGIYSVVGKGLDGVFAVGVEVLAAEAGGLAGVSAGDAVPVSLRLLPEFCIAPIRLVNLTPEELPPPFPPGPMPFGAGGGGAGGGGGGGAGGGGLGALLGAIAGGIGGYLAGNNDDDPASPGK